MVVLKLVKNRLKAVPAKLRQRSMNGILTPLIAKVYFGDLAHRSTPANNTFGPLRCVVRAYPKANMTRSIVANN